VSRLGGDSPANLVPKIRDHDDVLGEVQTPCDDYRLFQCQLNPSASPG
jgi:hypothetical protein